MRRLLLAATGRNAAAALPLLARATYGSALYLLQDTLIFPAPTIPRATLAQPARAAGATELSLTADDGTHLYGWHVDRGGDRLLLFFHGNGGGTAAAWLAPQLPGWDVASVCYRGYPGSDGAPSETGLALDSRALWTWATEERGVPPERIIVQGWSLGGGVAIELLTESSRPGPGQHLPQPRRGGRVACAGPAGPPSAAKTGRPRCTSRSWSSTAPPTR